MKVGDHKRSDLIYFYQTGLFGQNQDPKHGWKMKTLKTLLHDYNHQNVSSTVKTILLLKIAMKIL